MADPPHETPQAPSRGDPGDPPGDSPHGGRAIEVRLPKLADTLVEGTVTHWLKRAGETVTAGEPLVEVETDKVNSELESPASGVLTEILADEGTTVPVDEVIARIEAGGDDAGATAGGSATGTRGAPAPATDTGDAGDAAVRSESRLPALRRRIAERMQEARATIDQAAAALQVSVEGLHPAAGWNACFVKALAEAGGYRNIGVAVEVEGGLVVPVLRDVPDAPAAQVAERLRELAARARTGGLTPDEVTGGEITITNVGSTGTLVAFPLVNPGQPAILCPGQATDGGLLLTLCYDRQSMDENQVDRLLQRVGASLQELAA